MKKIKDRERSNLAGPGMRLPQSLGPRHWFGSRGSGWGGAKQREEVECGYPVSNFLWKGSFELTWALCHMSGDTPVWDWRDKEIRREKTTFIPSVQALKKSSRRNPSSSSPSCKSGPHPQPGGAGKLYLAASGSGAELCSGQAGNKWLFARLAWDIMV